MKNILTVVIIIFMGLVSANLFAEESIPIDFSIPSGLAKQACPSPIWNNLSVQWMGVKDKRSDPDVGIQTQKDKDPIPVVSSVPLEKVFDNTLRDLFQTCGMKFATSADENTLKLSAEIRNFYVGVQKKFLTGKSEAKSNIAFSAIKGNQAQSITVGYETDSKNIRSGNIKQLQKTLNSLFVDTIKQIPTTQEIKDLK